MFIAMNRFRIAEGREQDFESVWKNRQSYLAEVPGFVEFHLLRGPADSGAVPKERTSARRSSKVSMLSFE
jgi:heme-degrading monooxygenase HmoA